MDSHPPTTVPALYALAHGQECTGRHSCFYCGAPCGEGFSTRDYLRDSFTGRNEVPYPGSPWVCAGCVLCLREKIEINGRPNQKVRGYSWVVTTASATPYTKADRATLLRVCLEGPGWPGPWACVLSDSGQKHLLYRGVVNPSEAEPWTVTLEGERVVYDAPRLRERLDLCARLIAATGKPALAEAVAPNFALRVLSHFPESGEVLLRQWERVRETPLSRLAAWLSPPKEDCLREHPAPDPAAAGGAAGLR